MHRVQPDIHCLQVLINVYFVKQLGISERADTARKKYARLALRYVELQKSLYRHLHAEIIPR